MVSLDDTESCQKNKNLNVPSQILRNRVHCLVVKSAIAIIGSRGVDRETARTLFEQHLSSFLSQGRIWLLGGARGIDQWAMEWLLEQIETCWIVIPYTRARQPSWFHPWFEEVDRVIELQLPKRKTAYAIRNRHMVDLAQIVFGFWTSKGGSTVKTLKHALGQRKEVHAIPVSLDSNLE
jgi:predicted Rossmann fold nucleotide-binding protein DprA/Smf involved in DNA uptake